MKGLEEIAHLRFSSALSLHMYVLICFSFQEYVMWCIACVFICLYLCGCTCVQVQSLHICAYMRACMSTCACVQASGLISSLFHPSSTLFFGGSVSQSRPEPTDIASLASKIVLGILYPCFLRLEFQVGLYAHLVFA